MSVADSIANSFCQVNLCIPFPTERYAGIAFNSLRVDEEPRRGGSKKKLIVDGTKLYVSLKSNKAKDLRVAINSFLDLLTLVTQTMEEFDFAQQQQDAVLK